MDISGAILMIVFILGGVVGVFVGIFMSARLMGVIDDMIKEDKDNE